MSIDLANKHCVPYKDGMPPMPEDQIKNYLAKLSQGWEYLNGHIDKAYKFKDFKEAMAFVNKVAALAESENHHPNIHIFYNKVKLELSTHTVGGLSKNDFILASKVEALQKNSRERQNSFPT